MSAANTVGAPKAALPTSAAQTNTPYDSITINGQPAKIVNGEVQIPKGAKIEIKTHYDAGVLNQGPAEISLKQTGTATPATQAQLKKAWKMQDETFASPSGAPVPPHQMGGMRYENFSFTAPKTADGSGLAISLSQQSRQQTITLLPVSAQCGPVVAEPAAPAAPALAPQQADTAGFGGRPGGFGGHPGGFGGHPGGFGGFGHPGGFGGPRPGGFGWGHGPIGRPWFNPWNTGWGAMPVGWVPGCQWNPVWGMCPQGYYI